jgi:4-azaleucine resistance transporter AzlC
VTRNPDRRASLLEGIRLGLGPAAATFVLGLSFGAIASVAGWGLLLPVFFSVFAFSGSAQFALVTTLSGGTALAAVTAAVLINARYVVMSVALNDSLRGSRFQRALQAQALVDASFVVAHKGGGRFDIAKLAGASLPQWVTWSVGTALGVLAHPSPRLMHDLGADVIFPAFFLVLAMDELRRSRKAMLSALLGAAIAGGLLLVTEPGYALLGSTAAALVGALPWGSDRPGRRSTLWSRIRPRREGGR